MAAAGQTASPASERALATLCELYWLPLYGYVRRCVADEAEAKDLTQAFFAELLERNSVRVADPERGRFRSFLLTAFKHFLSKQWDKAKAQNGVVPSRFGHWICIVRIRKFASNQRRV